MDVGMKGMRRASQPPGGSTSVAFLMAGGDCPATPEKNSIRVHGDGSGGNAGLGRPYSVVGTMSPADPGYTRSSSRYTPSRNPITGDIMTPTSAESLGRPHSVAVEKPDVPSLNLDLASMTISEGGPTVEEPIAEETNGTEAEAPSAEEDAQSEAEPEPEPQPSSLEQWQELQLSNMAVISELKFPENEKDISATCQTRLGEDLARGTYVESDRMRSATSRPMSARAEARAGGTPAVPVNKPQPLGHQVKSLHESSLKMKVQSSVEFMNQKIRFSARTVNPTASRESLRTLCGYFFPSDGSMTIYEFKQLKRTNVAHHFIERNVHWHQNGPKKGMSYSVYDIAVGENLTFFPGDHPTLPEALGKDPSLTVRINSVDVESKKKCLTAMNDGRAPSDEELLLASISEEEARQRMFLRDVQAGIKSQLSGRAIRTLVGVLGLLIKADKAANNDLTCRVSKDEIACALKEYKIKLDGDYLDLVLDAVYETDPCAVNYLNFIDAITGGLDEARVSYVRRAFDKVDMEKSGIVNFMNLKKFANPSLSDNMELFQVYDKKMLQAGIGFAQFAILYLGLSLETESDSEFIKAVKDQWCLLGC